MEIDDAVDRGVKLLLFDGLQSLGRVKIQPGQAQKPFGEEAFAVYYEAPEELFAMLDNPNSFAFVADILGKKHAQYIKDITEYMVMRSQHEKIDPRLEGIVKALASINSSLVHSTFVVAWLVHSTWRQK